MFYVLLVIHCVLCVTLVIVVLLQQGKGADMGAALGGSSSTVFGAGGATDFFTKLTTSIAVAFMATSILLLRFYATAAGSAHSIANPMEGSVFQQEVQAQKAAAAQAAQAAEDAKAQAPAAPKTDDGVAAPPPAAQAVAVDPAANKAAEAPIAIDAETAAKAPAPAPAKAVAPEAKKKAK
jgi:preprotein translocase subunit SecG